jgi:hypothetical protein
MPYGFYEFVRFIALVGFSVLAYQSFKSKNINLTIIYIGFAILFQPLFKIALGRTLWNVTDIVVAIFLITTIIHPQIENIIKGK